MSKITDIQTILGVKADDVWGPKSEQALRDLLGTHQGVVEIEHHVKASSFADERDVAAFRRCKERGGSDQDCFKVGDNGIGCYGDDVTVGLWVALPPEDLVERWGSVDAAKHKPVVVSANNETVLAMVGDRMPHRVNIKNGAGIDLGPGVCRVLKLKPPVMIDAAWKWSIV